MFRSIKDYKWCINSKSLWNIWSWSGKNKRRDTNFQRMYKKYTDSTELSTEISELQKRCNFLVENELSDWYISMSDKINQNSSCNTCVHRILWEKLFMPLKTYLRNTMYQERLSALAVLKIENTIDVDLTKVIEQFSKNKNRTLSFF